jgi:hypothetical protein
MFQQSKKLCNRSQIENLVGKNDHSLSYVKPAFAKSTYWDKYQEILMNNVPP